MKQPTPLPDVKYLRACLDYNKRTGKLFWRFRPRLHFADTRNFNRWNRRYAFQEAFTATHKNGGKHGAIDWQPFVAHRVIWKWVTGIEPGIMVDHRDRVRTNNKWNNLRNVTRSQNMQNRKRHSNNRSGHPGVYFNRGERRWKAAIKAQGVVVFLGTYKAKRDAVRVRLAAEKKYHGQYSPRAA